MVTTRGISLLGGSALMWLLGRTLGLPELFVVAAATAALVAIAFLWVRRSTATVSARRLVATTRLVAGAATEVGLAVRNDAWLPASLLLLEDRCDHALRPDAGGGQPPRFVVAGLKPGRTAAMHYMLSGDSRGRYTVGPLSLRTRDPFRLAERVRAYPLTHDVVVYPRVEPLGDGLTRGNHHGSEASDNKRMFSSGDEFYTLREYVRGDELRQVHWPSTAHRNKLMVRQLEAPWKPEAVLFCDTRAGAHRGAGPDSTLEKALSVTASVLCHLADRRYELRLATEADARPPDASPWQALLDRLAELAPSRVESLAPALSRLRGAEAGGLLAAVLAPPSGSGPVAGHADVRALLATGRRFSGRLAVVVAASTTGTNPRGAELAGILSASGWQATVIGPRDSLTAAWPELLAGRRRRPTGMVRR
ncbi:MAG TPA: DUF58 domain-containing protein [Egibacteraceae bacterium]|nr:DUF58 domain-containing protein [Egibacteraceae bacterium]